VTARQDSPRRKETDEPARERFLREARAVASLQHPNICTLHDVGETGDGSIFLVMELLHGDRSRWRRSWTPASPWPTLSTRRTPLASCIATSSRRTSS
jgi:serine/threonine protein kinase